MRNLVSSWASSDPESAGQWLANLPAGRSREAAVQSYVSQISYQSPELAAPWADRISDLNMRNSQIENIARRWLDMDRSAAEAWLAKVSLPEERKAALLKQAK